MLASGCHSTSGASTKPVKSATDPLRLVVRVIDGDTILLDNNERIRLIGVDTPESVDPRKAVQYFGKEATAFMNKLVRGKHVALTYDRDRIDRYGRTLAYVHLQDGTFINSEIIKNGYGFAYVQYPFKYMEEFRSYENDARKLKKGMWAGS